jgi:nitrite reductase/ring-hydroxylating ferredoxin subunit
VEREPELGIHEGAGDALAWERNGGGMGEFTTVTALNTLEGRELAAFGVSGNRIAIARVGDNFYAFGDTCTHQGCSLADGELEGTTVTCPCHGSRFNVTTGDVLRGPAREPVLSYPVRLEDNALQVEV